MDDDTIRTLFESLDAEPRPEFIATLRRRVEHELVDHQERTGAFDDLSDRTVPIDLEVPAAVQPVAGRRERRRNVAIVLAAAATIVAALVVLIRTHDQVKTVDTAVTPSSTTSLAPSPPATTVLPAVEQVEGRLQATIAVANTADSIAVTDDAVWVSGWDGRTVSRIDAETNEVTTLNLGHSGARVAAGEDGVWVGVDGGLLLRLDPDTGEVIATIDTSSPPVTPSDSTPSPSPAPSPSKSAPAPSPFTGNGGVWVQDVPTGVVSRVDPQTNEVAASVDLSASGFIASEGMVIADGLVWVNTCGGPVSIDTQTLTVSEPVALSGCGNALGMADGSLWVGVGRRTARIDPVNRRVEVILDVGPIDGAPFVATGDGGVWRPLSTSRIARIDTATNTVTQILDLGRTGQVAGFAVGHGSLWAGDYGGRDVLRIEQEPAGSD